MLGVSLSTVRRRMAEYHLSVHSRYSTINDDELDSIVREIKVQFPNSGYRIMDGLLRQHGMRIPALEKLCSVLIQMEQLSVLLNWFIEGDTMYQVLSLYGTLMVTTN